MIRIRFAFLSCAVLYLAACDPLQQADAWVIACSSIPTADAGFQIYVATGKVDPRIVADEALAVKAAQAACNGPAPTDVKTAIAYVQRITTQILQDMAQAKKQAGA